jgi:hypothetical protein
VMFLCLGSAFWMVLVSLLTTPPRQEVIKRYFERD